jgi:hypothetical protein
MFNQPLRSGLGNSAAYQVSGYPWITGSVIPTGTGYYKIAFPSVTKSFTIINKDSSEIYNSGLVGSSSLYVFFGPEPVTSFPYPQIAKNHFIGIPQAEDGFTFNIKCREVFIAKMDTSHTGAFQLMAELTNIEFSEMPALTGSGITD